MSDHHGCTEESPCSNPALRWVHSNRCQIGCLGRTVKGLRELARSIEKERNSLLIALRDACIGHADDCKCAGCALAFAPTGTLDKEGQ